MSVKLMVGVPCHSGSIVVQTAATLLAAQEVARDRGGSFWFSTYGGAIVSVVRNAIAAHFISSEADLLLMVDADTGIERATIERMIDLNQPVVGCMVPMRRYVWGNVHLHASTDPTIIPRQALTYVGCLEVSEAGELSIINGCARASHVGTGAMLIRREALETLMAHFPELEGLGFDEDSYPGLDPNWGFFNHMSREDGPPSRRTFLSADGGSRQGARSGLMSLAPPHTLGHIPSPEALWTPGTLISKLDGASSKIRGGSKVAATNKADRNGPSRASDWPRRCRLHHRRFAVGLSRPIAAA